LLAGVTISTLISAGLAAFGAPFLLRGNFGIDLQKVAFVMAALGGGASFIGTLLGGPLADHLSKRNPRLTLRVPAVAYLIAAPALALAFDSDSLGRFIGLSLIGQMAATIYLGPTFGALHNMVEARMRATAVAIVFLIVSLVGLGLGPVLVGTLSDAVARTLPASLPGGCLGSPSAGCHGNTFGGLKIAMVVFAALYLWPAFHYFRAASHLGGSLSAVPGIRPARGQ
jgi:hypothetical protein